MAAALPAMRPLGCWNSVRSGLNELGRRSLYTKYSSPKEKIPFPQNLPPQFMRQIPERHRPDRAVGRRIKVPAPPPSKCREWKDPVAAFTQDQLAIVDPTGERKALFDRRNHQSVKVGDVLRVTFKSGDPFAGVCLNIRARGLDSGFLLRNRLTRVGCEMWIKVFSPNVQSVEIVQRTEKRKRRARLYYMRHPRHDMGSVDGIVRQYLRSRSQQQGITR
ncbi:ribosomal protein L19 [Helicocarpus griseus UAMH5409]|uniref:Ribosomal protein L19 n=1 Tax=Helicocarpus griseus UAMH5409 TaxID=1447875 RepID=A0A2B7XUU2_9EURO|nr:ribosomal protein L19 [Helicocarpus griseus UAMH5409]